MVIAALQTLVSLLETPDDTFRRFRHMNLQTATIEVGIDLGLFKHLMEASQALTVG
ncbi:hypothetical protein GGR51DRAFT_198329 [Nemania sp. FL0031]|nr:hypothetical protein GGR51DRAFT_198329 [Nemania sp. FL0031]